MHSSAARAGQTNNVQCTHRVYATTGSHMQKVPLPVGIWIPNFSNLIGSHMSKPLQTRWRSVQTFLHSSHVCTRDFFSERFVSSTEKKTSVALFEKKDNATSSFRCWQDVRVGMKNVVSGWCWETRAATTATHSRESTVYCCWVHATEMLHLSAAVWQIQLSCKIDPAFSAISAHNRKHHTLMSLCTYEYYREHIFMFLFSVLQNAFLRFLE